jgi:hypothetical protein
MPSGSYSTIGPVAQQVELHGWLLAYLIVRGCVSGPSLQVPGRRLFSEEDINRIRAVLNEGRDISNQGTR